MKIRLLLLTLTLLFSAIEADQQRIRLNLTDEKLIDVVNRIAALKDINLILPEKQDGLMAKVTMHLDEEITVNEAWNLVETLLGMANFSIVPHGDMFAVIAAPDATSVPLPLCVNTPIELIPNSDEY